MISGGNPSSENQLAACRRQEIDAAFAGMATDAAYREEALQLCEEFAAADREALVSEERGSSQAPP